jgi:pimeloyl-ACP methyl ester carboxylesterase
VVTLTVPRLYQVRVPSGRHVLDGDLSVPREAQGTVLFAHGSGSSRHSPRNRLVASKLNEAGFATLLLDLLTPGEEQVDDISRKHRFDIPLLAGRLVDAILWLDLHEATAGLPVGLFGASTGGAAAIVAAAEHPAAVSAVVSRGGRPDLAEKSLETISAPVLLIVGGRDEVVLDLNRQAFERMAAVKQLEVVPGATHLFEEAGALDEVARLAGEWFARHLH